MKTIKVFDEFGVFVGFAKFDNSDGFYDFIDSVIVEDFSEVVDFVAFVE